MILKGPIWIFGGETAFHTALCEPRFGKPRSKVHSVLNCNKEEAKLPFPMVIEQPFLGKMQMSISCTSTNKHQITHHMVTLWKENKQHNNSVYFVLKTSEITIQFFSQVP